MKPDGKGYEGRDDLGIYHHFTVAIDTDNIKRVFDDVRDMAMDSNTLIRLKLSVSLPVVEFRGTIFSLFLILIYGI